MKIKGTKNRYPRIDKGKERILLPPRTCIICKDNIRTHKYNGDKYAYPDWIKRKFCSIRCSRLGRKVSKESISKGIETRRRLDHYWNKPESRVKLSLALKKNKIYEKHIGMKYEMWRMNVIERDDYTCQICKNRGGKVQAHHVYSWSEFIEKRYEISNGITLCHPCHKKVHFQDSKIKRVCPDCNNSRDLYMKTRFGNVLLIGHHLPR